MGVSKCESTLIHDCICTLHHAHPASPNSLCIKWMFLNDPKHFSSSENVRATASQIIIGMALTIAIVHTFGRKTSTSMTVVPTKNPNEKRVAYKLRYVFSE